MPQGTRMARPSAADVATDQRVIAQTRLAHQLDESWTRFIPARTEYHEARNAAIIDFANVVAGLIDFSYETQQDSTKSATTFGEWVEDKFLMRIFNGATISDLERRMKLLEVGAEEFAAYIEAALKNFRPDDVFRLMSRFHNNDFDPREIKFARGVFLTGEHLG